MAGGSITERLGSGGRKTYRVRVEYDPDPQTGKRRQRSRAFPTRKEADRALRAWLSEIEAGHAVLPSRQTVSVYLDAWLLRVRHHLRPTSHRQYASRIKAKINPALGTIPLQRLTAAQVEDFETALLDRGLASATVIQCHVVLRKALRDAVRLNLITSNPTDGVKPPPLRRPDLAVWDAVQARAFIAAAQADELWPFWLLAITTGMRRGELMGLRWRDLDLAGNAAAVQQQIIRLDGEWYTGPPKNAAGRRRVDLSPESIRALILHRANQSTIRDVAGSGWQDLGLVFTDEIGMPVGPGVIANHFAAIRTRAGLPKIRLHDLRHTSATLDLANGVHIKIVSDKLGHSDPSMTWKRYVHATPGMGRAAALALDALLFTEPEAAPEIAVVAIP